MLYTFLSHHCTHVHPLSHTLFFLSFLFLFADVCLLVHLGLGFLFTHLNALPCNSCTVKSIEHVSVTIRNVSSKVQKHVIHD